MLQKVDGRHPRGARHLANQVGEAQRALAGALDIEKLSVVANQPGNKAVASGASYACNGSSRTYMESCRPVGISVASPSPNPNNSP